MCTSAEYSTIQWFTWSLIVRIRMVIVFGVLLPLPVRHAQDNTPCPMGQPDAIGIFRCWPFPLPLLGVVMASFVGIIEPLKVGWACQPDCVECFRTGVCWYVFNFAQCHCSVFLPQCKFLARFGWYNLSSLLNKVLVMTKLQSYVCLTPICWMQFCGKLMSMVPFLTRYIVFMST